MYEKWRHFSFFILFYVETIILGGSIMNEKSLSNKLKEFEEYLLYDVENSDYTTKKYVSEAKKFLIWLYDVKSMSISKIDKKLIVEYK